MRNYAFALYPAGIVKLCFSLLLLAFSACQPSQENAAASDGPAPDPLHRLIEGNDRYQHDHPAHPDQSLERMKALKEGQHPFAVVVSCSDSRVPPELIFDQGLGDIFVIRTAGNVIGDYELGSIEYAVEHLGVRLVVVMGHENCGAIASFCEHKKHPAHGHIQAIIEYLAEEEEEKRLDENTPDYLEKAVKANVIHGVRLVKQSDPLLRPLAARSELQVKGAVYDLDDGVIHWISDDKP